MIYMHKIRKKIIEWLDKIKVYDFSKIINYMVYWRTYWRINEGNENSRSKNRDLYSYENLKENIQKVISEIPKEKYENIFKGAYERPEKYVPKNKTRKIKKNYKWFLYGLGLYKNRHLKCKKV